MTVPAGFSTMPKSFDEQGFQIFPTATAALPSSPTDGAAAGDVSSKGGKSPLDSLNASEEDDAPSSLQMSRLLGSAGVGLVLAALYLVL